MRELFARYRGRVRIVQVTDIDPDGVRVEDGRLVFDSVLCIEVEKDRVSTHCITYRCVAENGEVRECIAIAGEVELDVYIRNVLQIDIEKFIMSHIAPGLVIATWLSRQEEAGRS